MKKKFVLVLALSFFCVFFLSLSSLKGQQTPDPGKVLGAWEVEVNSDGEYYYLSLNIEKSESGLKGVISESSGAFTDVPLSNIQFDGATLKFEFNSPTPPDGYERLVKAELKIVESKLEGFFIVEDLEAKASATATRKK